MWLHSYAAAAAAGSRSIFHFPPTRKIISKNERIVCIIALAEKKKMMMSSSSSSRCCKNVSQHFNSGNWNENWIKRYKDDYSISTIQRMQQQNEKNHEEEEEEEEEVSFSSYLFTIRRTRTSVVVVHFIERIALLLCWIEKEKRKESGDKNVVAVVEQLGTEQRETGNGGWGGGSF